ncbi:uncharacterized protein N7500_004482 [Penicillium coprophilum]|uniref:uncharacterized protein n=1 Tax=Penicillium coprophilum TaxID=36646 RepID=UPI0023A2F7B6|nr:uncharacterized protein N7500_004482 [Penicillium coprophilum]KAJ5162652.1 hypothetical protein N7500_004482 [Penicillium coprophilum]
MRCIIQPSASSKNLILTDSPLPTPNHAQGEHLIQIKACSPCAGELLWPANFPPSTERTLIPCPDMAGIVISAPEDSPFQPGDEVYARTNYVRPGNGREYSIAVTDELAHKPKDLSWVQAAAVPVSAETAWQVLFVHALATEANGEEMDMETAKTAWAGKKILVTAASGGVGIWLVQLATLLGAEVVATCGPRNVEFVRSLGAKEVLDYRVVDVKEWAQVPSNKVDVVVDCIGGKALEDAWWTVKDGGVVLSIFRPPVQDRPDSFEGAGVKDKFFIMQPVRRQLEEISKLIEKGVCRGLVDSVWPLEQYEEVFKRLDGGHARGKVVFDFSLNH